MGLSSSSKTSDTTPTYAPQLTSAANTVTGAYNANAATTQADANTISGLVPSLASQYTAGNPALTAQQNYITNELGSNPASNPQLQNVINSTNADVTGSTDANLGTRGLTGGTAIQNILSRNLGTTDSNLQYQDYSNQQQLQAQAAAMAPSNAAAQDVAIAPLLAAASTASTLPTTSAEQYANSIGGLLGSYTNNTTTTNPSTASSIGSGLNAAGQLASLFSDRRLKEDIRRVGLTDGGLPVYTYRYAGQAAVHMGVMAQDVAEMQPAALGPVVHGFATVSYGEVR